MKSSWLNQEIKLSSKTKNRVDKFVRGLMFFATALLFITAFMLPSLILSGKHLEDPVAWILILSFILFMIIFGFMCLLLATKFKYELTFNDKERIIHWDKLSSAYKKFWIFQEVFATLFASYMLICGFVFLFYFKDWLVIIAFFSSVSMLISVRRQYLDIKDKKEAKILKGIVYTLFEIILFVLIALILALLIINFGRYYL